LMSADSARGLDPTQEAILDYQGSLRARRHTREMTTEAAAEKRQAIKTMNKALTLAKKANEVMATKDATVVRQRQDSLDDLHKALEVEEENRDNNVKIEELRNKIARAQGAKVISAAEIKEVKAKSAAKLQKVNAKVEAMAGKVKEALDAKQKMMKKMEEMKKNLVQEKGEVLAARAGDSNNTKTEEAIAKQKAAEAKEELLMAKKSKKQQEARVKDGKDALKKAEAAVKKVQTKAQTAIKSAAAAKDDTAKGLVQAQVAASALRRVAALQHVEILEKKKVRTEKAEFTRRRIELRFQKLKSESRGQAHLEAVNRSKNRGKKKADAKEKIEKAQIKADSEAKLQKSNAKDKKKYEREKLKAEEKEKEEVAKTKSENKAMKNAEEAIKEDGKEAKMKVQAKKMQAEEEKAKEKQKYLYKARSAISNEFDKQQGHPDPAEVLSLSDLYA